MEPSFVNVQSSRSLLDFFFSFLVVVVVGERVCLLLFCLFVSLLFYRILFSFTSYHFHQSPQGIPSFFAFLFSRSSTFKRLPLHVMHTLLYSYPIVSFLIYKKTLSVFSHSGNGFRATLWLTTTSPLLSSKQFFWLSLLASKFCGTNLVVFTFNLQL